MQRNRTAKPRLAIRPGPSASGSTSGAAEAAALSAHFAKNLSLSFSTPGSRIGGTQAVRKRPKKKRVTEEEYNATLDLAERWGLVKKPPRPPAPLTAEEWRSARDKALDRDDHDNPCPICYEEFGISPQVILSCSHVFHRACLNSFERYAVADSETCPLCRQQNYEKLVIRDGEQVHKTNCAVAIQALVRGYQTRVRNEEMLRHIIPQDPDRRRLFYGKKLSSVSRRLITHLDAQSSDIDAILAESDNALNAMHSAASDLETRVHRQVLQKSEIESELSTRFTASTATSGPFDSDINTTNEDSVYIPGTRGVFLSHGDAQVVSDSLSLWPDAEGRAESRVWWSEECSICITALCCNDKDSVSLRSKDGRGRGRGRGRGKGKDAAVKNKHDHKQKHKHQKPLSILSCSHVFHTTCISAFEHYAAGVEPTCPICRSVYERRRIVNRQ